MNKIDNQSKEEMVSEAKGFAKWFAVDIVIKLFGIVIWQYHFPPKKNLSV